MYKEVVFITLLAVAASGFPASGVEDIGTAAPEDKTVAPFRTNSGNPDELTENSDQLATNLRKTRGCFLVLGGNCGDTGADPKDVFAHMQATQLNQQKGDSGLRNDIFGFVGSILKFSQGQGK